MTDYKKLVEALRCCIPYPPEKCVGCTYNIGNNECAVRMMMTDAADAIEALQAQLPKRGEIVRCGECKYHMAETERTNPYCNKYHCMRTDDWFCADGEREVQDG